MGGVEILVLRDTTVLVVVFSHFISNSLNVLDQMVVPTQVPCHDGPFYLQCISVFIPVYHLHTVQHFCIGCAQVAVIPNVSQTKQRVRSV